MTAAPLLPAGGEPPAILVVDDDPLVLHALEVTLTSAGHRVIATGDPLAGLDRLRAERMSVVIADQRMDAMTGLELLDHARGLQPDASRILITGLASVKTLSDAVNRGEIFRFIAKPWATAELLATVHNAVQRHQSLVENAALHSTALRTNDELRTANRDLETRLADVLADLAQFETELAALRSTRGGLFEFCEAVLTAFQPVLAARTRHAVECCRLLAQAAGLPPEFREQLLAAAWFHDLGLLALPRATVVDTLRNRVNPHDESGASFRKHPEVGARLTIAAGLGEEIVAAIRAHHESFDGSGFPDGLQGRQIPELARWLTPVAYFVGSGLSRERAAEEIQHLAGRAFDPAVVPHILRIVLQLPSPEAIARETVSAPGFAAARKGYLLQ